MTACLLPGRKTFNAAQRRYSIRVSACLALYVITILIAAFWAGAGHRHGAISYALSILPGASVVAIIAVMGLYLREEKDEFLRMVQVHSLLWSTGITLAIATTWGFLENFADAPQAPLYLIFPLYCAIWGVAGAYIQRRYK
jgi:hypothetical protein